jgi:ketosteroid isomerase-like protein
VAEEYRRLLCRCGSRATSNKLTDLEIDTDGKIAFAHYTSHFSSTDAKGAKVEIVIRTTECLKKIDGKWLIVPEHNSVPVDLANGARADLMSKM